MKATLVHHEKRLISHKSTGEIGIAELKVWNVPKSKTYRQGLKYSLFLVVHGEVIIGMDNHHPKGPHLHLGNQELPYELNGIPELIKDFWDLSRKAGFSP
jgi:hypothetical protein